MSHAVYQASAKAYGFKGSWGYVHPDCLEDFIRAHGRYDAQGRFVSGPMQERILTDLAEHNAGTLPCMYCNTRLDRVPISRNEEEALALAADKTRLRKRLQEARATLHRTIDFGKGTFDFANRRLVGENGLVLQWQTRFWPDRPESYHNQQTNRGCVICLDSIESV